jgi:integrase
MNAKEKAVRRPKARANGEGTVFQRADGRWVAKITVGLAPNGRQKFKERTAATEKEALLLKRTLLDEHAAGIISDPERTTVQQYLERWLESKRGQVKPRTLELYEYDLKHYAIPRIGRHKLTKLTAMHVQAMQEDIRRQVQKDSEGKKDGARTASSVTAILSRALGQAVEWALTIRNPARGVKRPRITTREARSLNLTEVMRLLDAARGSRHYALYYLAVATGLRRGELLALHWRDVDLERSRLTVRHTVTVLDNQPEIGEPKSKRSRRVIEFDHDVAEVLREHKQRQALERKVMDDLWHDQGLVFPSEVGSLLYPSNLHRNFVILRAKAGLPGIVFHELRHTYASLNLRKGMNIVDLSASLGHETVAFTLSRYTHVVEELKGRRGVGLARLLEEALTEPSETLVSGAVSGLGIEKAGGLN